MRGALIRQEKKRWLRWLAVGVIALLLVACVLLVTSDRFQHWLDHRHGVDGSKILMQNIVQALDAYKVQFGHYPTRLEALVERGVMPSMPIDKWGRPFIYQKHSEASYSLSSFGADGQPGGCGKDVDTVIP